LQAEVSSQSQQILDLQKQLQQWQRFNPPESTTLPSTSTPPSLHHMTRTQCIQSTETAAAAGGADVVSPMKFRDEQAKVKALESQLRFVGYVHTFCVVEDRL
jgi:hypothetical protein